MHLYKQEAHKEKSLEAITWTQKNCKLQKLIFWKIQWDKKFPKFHWVCLLLFMYLAFSIPLKPVKFFVSLLGIQNLELRFLHNYRHGCIIVSSPWSYIVESVPLWKTVSLFQCSFLYYQKIMCPKVCVYF